MNRNDEKTSPQRGVSLVELLAVITIIAIMSALALPSYLEWRRGIVYRTAARDIVSMLRDAKSSSIASNRNCQVQFDAANRSFGMRRGDRSRNTNWAAIAAPAWVVLPSGVSFNSNVDVSVDPAGGVVFNPDGTIVSAATVTVLDINLVPRLTIDIIPSGKIKIK